MLGWTSLYSNFDCIVPMKSENPKIRPVISITASICRLSLLTYFGTSLWTRWNITKRNPKTIPEMELKIKFVYTICCIFDQLLDAACNLKPVKILVMAFSEKFSRFLIYWCTKHTKRSENSVLSIWESTPKMVETLMLVLVLSWFWYGMVLTFGSVVLVGGWLGLTS